MIRLHKKSAAIVLAAGLCVSPLAFTSLAANPVAPAQRTEVKREAQPLAFPAGFQMKAGQADEGIKTGLVKLTERAVTKNDFNNLLAELSKPDRERAREFKGVDQAKLDGIIDKIQKQWMAKYGSKFDLNHKDTIFDSRFQMIQGEVTDPAAALTDWPVPVTMNNEPVTASGKVPAAANTKEEKKEVKEAKLEKGRNVALVRFPAEFAMPEMTVSMIHHLPTFWRISIPDDRTGEQIYNDLTAQLSWIADHADQWPANVDDAYRVVAYHAVAALYGVNIATSPHAKG